MQIISLFLLTLAFAPAAVAEDEIIVVTATRTPTPTSRLPARVDTVTREDIEAQSLTSLTQAIGANAVQSGGAGQQASVFLRGANSAHTLALLDGVRLNDSSNPAGQYDFGLDTLGGLDRVETLRGPASAIYGSDAIGGVVNLIPRRSATSAFAPFLEASAGSFDTKRALMGAAGSAGGVDYGVSADVFDTDGYDLVPKRMSTHTGNPDGARVATFTASARANFGAWAGDVLLRERSSRTEFDTFSGGPFFDLRADDPALDTRDDQSVWRVGAETGEALRFRVSGGQVRNDRVETDAGFQDSAAQATQSFIDANARWTRGETVVTGGLAFNRDAIETQPQFANQLSVSEDQKAAYLIAQTPLAAHFDATASVRGDNYASFGTHATYGVGIVAAFAPLRVFASYGVAFRAPSLSERFERSLFNVGNPGLDPERSRSWEIGADWKAGEALTLGASYYQTRINDLINYDFALLKNVNIDRAKIDGAEANIDAHPFAWGALRLAYDYTDATNALTGAELTRRPRDSWRLDASITPMQRLAFALSWTYVGARTDVTYDNGGNFLSGSGRVPSYNVGALSATFDLNAHAQLFARIDNLTDQNYEQPAAFAGAPRNGMVGVRTRF